VRSMPPLISDDGTITIHGQEGAQLLINLVDENGLPRDVSALDVRFKIPGFSKNFTATGVPGELKVILLQTDLPNLIGKVADYAIVEHGPQLPSVHYYGKLIMVGWR